MQLNDIRSFVSQDIARVDQIIAEQLGSEVAMIRQLGEYIFGSGGKRLRPILVILSARVFGYQGHHHHLLAAIVELIHTATLLHDDVVDDANLRRGRQTANNIWGNNASVLVGDFLYSRAFQMMVEVDSMPVMSVLANAANIIAEGEVMQLMHRNDPSVTEKRYLEIIRRKTATLFEASAQLGAIVAGRPLDEIDAMANFGLHVGLAFQIIDDALDYCASEKEIGKNIGNDLAEGNPTLPIIQALKEGTPAQAAVIRHAIATGESVQLDIIQQAIEATNGIAYSYQVAHKHARIALECLEAIPQGPIIDVLKEFTRFTIERNY